MITASSVRVLDRYEVFAYELLRFSYEPEAKLLAAWLRKRPEFLARVRRAQRVARRAVERRKP